MKVPTGKKSPGTVVEKGKYGTLEIKSTPDVDIPRWMSSLSMDGCTAVHDPHSSPRGGPAVLFSLLKDPSKPPNQGRYSCILAVWGEVHNDGVNMYFVARPYEAGSPLIHMKFKEWRPERGMAAILAVLAFHAEQPRLPRRDDLANDWLRSVRDKIHQSFYRTPGSFAERMIHPEVIKAEALCKKRFESLAGLDVPESLARVRKEFKLLAEHLSEDEILKVWRETVIESVLKS